METKSPVAALMASRKAALFAFASILVLVMALSLEVAIVVAAIRGRIALEVAITLSFGPLATGALGVIVLAAKAIDAIAKEDAASKGAVAPLLGELIAAPAAAEPPKEGGAS